MDPNEIIRIAATALRSLLDSTTAAADAYSMESAEAVIQHMTTYVTAVEELAATTSALR